MKNETDNSQNNSIIKFAARLVKERSYETILLFVLFAVFCLYPLTNSPHDVVHVLRTALDDQIPRVPAFSIIYLAFLPWAFITIICAWYNKRDFEQLAYSMILINLIACLAYLFFQTYVPRQPVLDDDIFSKILKFIYSYDRPYDCFPSLHAAFSASIAMYLVFMRSKWAWISVLFAILIVISTLFVKQHFIADAVSGVLLGITMTWLVHSVSKRSMPASPSNV